MGVQIGRLDVDLLSSPGTPGYEEAWAELFRQYYGCLLNRLRRHYRALGCPDGLAGQLAADMAADTWDALPARHFRRLRAYDPDRGSFTAYLGTLADEQRALAARAQARQLPWAALPDDVAGPGESDQPVVAVMLVEYQHRLSPALRQVVQDQLGDRPAPSAPAPATAKKRKTRALHALLEYLGAPPPPGQDHPPKKLVK